MGRMGALAIIVAVVIGQTPPAPPMIIEPVLYYASGSVTPLDINRSNLESIRRYARSPGVTSIAIRAHADTIGSASANMELSRARAQAIADLLIADGTPASIIRLDPRGESEPARPTPDEVDEPLNRRVWVDISLGRSG